MIIGCMNLYYCFYGMIVNCRSFVTKLGHVWPGFEIHIALAGVKPIVITSST